MFPEMSPRTYFKTDFAMRSSEKLVRKAGQDLMVSLIETQGERRSVRLSLTGLTIGQAWHANLIEENQTSY